MTSAIDPSKPVDGVPAVKADLRANLLAAKTEIEALQGVIVTSVLEHGASGDGATDDTAAIQNAIDAVSAAGGGILFFPAGVYIISATINFKANVVLEGEFGGTMIEMADDSNIPGMFKSSGAIPFFGMRDMILNGNRLNQTNLDSVGLWLQHNSTTGAFGGNSIVGHGNEIVDTHAIFENIVIVGIRGEYGINAPVSCSSCYFRNVAVIGIRGVGIRTLINDATWWDCLVGATTKEGWVCAGGSGRYYGCKAFFVGDGFDVDTQTYGNYGSGCAFRAANGDQVFVGCEGQDVDGPAFVVQGGSCTISGCYASQACNLEGTSGAIGQNPIRGGGYSLSKRVAVALMGSSAQDCVIDMVVRDNRLGTEFAPDLQGFVDLRNGAANNVIIISGDYDILAAGQPLVQETNLTAYSQNNYLVTPLGPWRSMRTLDANDTTPLIFGGGIFITNNATPTTIIDFDFIRNGLGIGEEFWLQIDDANTTVQNGANIVTKSGSNITAQGLYHFMDVGGAWYEV